MTFELRPVYTNTPTKQKSYKKSLVGFDGPNCLKIIFALLIELVAVYGRFSIIYIWHFGFKGLLTLY